MESWECPESVVLLTKCDEVCQEVVNAKKKEYDNMVQNDVFDIVPYQYQPTISSCWVITEKLKDGKKIAKARLVARGFEENTDDLRKDSPTCCRESLRLLFMTAAVMNWMLHSIDVSAAFLQGNPIKRKL